MARWSNHRSGWNDVHAGWLQGYFIEFDSDCTNTPLISSNIISPKDSLDGNYEVSWSAVSNVSISHYELSESITANFTNVKQVYIGSTKTNIQFKNKNKGVYYYRIRACNSLICGEYLKSPTAVNVKQGADSDGDKITNSKDNCPTVSNPDQKDLDKDGKGDVCDSDRDGDKIDNSNDIFPDDPKEWLDTDKDGKGNNADLDDDNDGLPDVWEITYGLDPLLKNDAATDKDGDGLSNLQEFTLKTNPTKTDSDGDGTNDKDDKFPKNPKVSKDTDNDGIGDKLDNCPNKANKDQKDTDKDGIGDVCEVIGTKSQVVEISACSAMRVNSIITCQIQYSTTDNETKLNGLGLHLYYDNSRLTLVDINNIVPKGFTSNDSTPLSDSNNGDADPKTNQYLRFAWADAQSSWPNKVLPAMLFTIRFKVNATLVAEDTTVIRFSASETATGYGFVGKPHKLRVKNSCSLDVDDNGETKALTDGLLILRYFFDFTGETLIKKAIDEKAKRSTAIDIENYLADCKDSFDIDDNGETKALTDGLLILRYLFGFTGETLTKKAVGEGAKRKTAGDIEAYLLNIKN